MYGFCDETGTHSSSRWWAITAIWLPDSQLPKCDAAVARVRQQTNCWGEFKWEKVGDRHVRAYQAVIKAILGLDGVRITCMAVDTRLLTPEAMKEHHPEGGKQELYMKQTRLLLQRRIRDFAAEGHARFTVLYDEQSVPKPLRDRFRSQLHYDISQERTPDAQSCAFDHLSPANSKVVPMLQVTDLVSGAIWSALEGKPDTSKQATARATIRKEAASWAGQPLTQATSSAGGRFNLWKWRP